MVTVMREDDLIPRQRSRLPLMCAVVLGILALGFSFLLDSDRYTERAGLIAFSFMLETSLYSVCLFAEEWIFHLKQRFETSLLSILRAFYCSSYEQYVTISNICDPVCEVVSLKFQKLWDLENLSLILVWYYICFLMCLTNQYYIIKDNLHRFS